ncbi:hypothetical protein CDD83_9791 [Cordyceps sp. RAO-2017]|nr:hypothetical protein CDD83_9791 [Cordyceps sp. RAO-2017]
MPFRQRVARHFGDTLSPEKSYLSYYDVLLTVEDVKALKHDWLTDNNIAFWEEYLERETLSRYPQAHIVLLRPSMTFLLMKEPDSRLVRAALPDFNRVTHVFLPINDNRNVGVAEGGSHWSLLLVSVIDGLAFHYDSLGGANYAEANFATRKLAEMLGRPFRFINLEDCPQQENGSDCGVFVCLLMRHLLVKRLLSANAREKVSMSMAGKMVDSHGGRKEMLRIIENLRKEGERRRSATRHGSAAAFEQFIRDIEAGRLRVQPCKSSVKITVTARPQRAPSEPKPPASPRVQRKRELPGVKKHPTAREKKVRMMRSRVAKVVRSKRAAKAAAKSKGKPAARPRPKPKPGSRKASRTATGAAAKKASTKQTEGKPASTRSSSKRTPFMAFTRVETRSQKRARLS